MSTMINVALDAMGGDNAPVEMIKGAVDAVKEKKQVHVFLVGQEDVLESLLSEYEYPKDQITIINASEVIETAESPVAAVRRKKDSSIVVAMKMVKDGRADAFVSAGSSGAILVGGQLIVGRSAGIERSPLAVLMPSEKGITCLIDCGANVDAKPSNLVQFAQMGSIYMEHIVGVENPKVAIVNIGAEEEKGNRLVKETFPLLRECKNINFIGSIESREIPAGQADVVVCEAFTGNVILKLYEGLAKTFMHVIKDGMTSTFLSTIGAAMCKSSLKNAFKKFDASEYGGAPLLGLKGLVVKAHGNSTGVEIKTAILQCITFKEQMINEWIHECITGEYVPELHEKDEAQAEALKDETKTESPDTFPDSPEEDTQTQTALKEDASHPETAADIEKDAQTIPDKDSDFPEDKLPDDVIRLD